METAAGLNAAGVNLHKLFVQARLRIHTVPCLAFVHDASLERGFEVEGLIRRALTMELRDRRLRARLRLPCRMRHPMDPANRIGISASCAEPMPMRSTAYCCSISR